jgi:AraC-like DNA-binding protein
MTNSPDDPLKKFPAFRTSNPDELVQSAFAVFGATKMDLRTPHALDVRANFVELQDIALAFGAINSDVILDNPAGDFVRLQISTKGRGSTTVGGEKTEIDESRACITPANRISRVFCESGHQRLTLRLKVAPLERKLATLIGAKPNRKLEFAPALDFDRPHFETLRRLLLLFARQLDPDSVRYPTPFIRELEQAIIVGFLSVTDHAFNDILKIDDRTVESSYVRRIEEYIEAHWDQAILAEVIAREAGINPRTLYRAFRRTRGYSPMAFAKQIRLRHAREMLVAAIPSTTVTAVALACSFANLGHFAKDYAKAFGEAPSETLARAKRKAGH